MQLVMKWVNARGEPFNSNPPWSQKLGTQLPPEAEKNAIVSSAKPNFLVPSAPGKILHTHIFTFYCSLRYNFSGSWTKKFLTTFTLILTFYCVLRSNFHTKLLKFSKLRLVPRGKTTILDIVEVFYSLWESKRIKFSNPEKRTSCAFFGIVLKIPKNEHLTKDAFEYKSENVIKSTMHKMPLYCYKIQ